MPTHVQGDQSAAITCLISSSDEAGNGICGAASSAGYIIAGGSDSSIVVLDVRAEGRLCPVDRWVDHSGGVYALCMVGDRAVVSGDGRGMLLVHDIMGGENGCLKYGLGASSRGAVRCLTCVDHNLVACGEDGKVLLYSYTTP
jgi:hypothetical protein